MNSRRNHRFQISRVESLQSETFSGSLKRNVKERLWFGPIGGENGLDFRAKFRPITSPQTALGHNRRQDMLLHFVGLLTTENLAKNMKAFSGILKTLRSKNRTKKNTKGRACLVSSQGSITVGNNSTFMMEERSSQAERGVLVDQAVGEQRPATLILMVGVCTSFNQQLSNSFGMCEVSLLKDMSDKCERSVAMVVRSVDDDVVVLVNASVVHHVLDKLYNVSDMLCPPVGSQDHMEDGLIRLGLKAREESRELRLWVLTMLDGGGRGRHRSWG